LFKIKFIEAFLFLGRKNYAGSFKQNEIDSGLVTDLVYYSVFTDLFITGDRLAFFVLSFSLVVSLIFPSLLFLFFFLGGGLL
jgi:hypothetical protein